jgi:hypothetical protein
MGLESRAKDIVRSINDNSSYYETNETLFNIFEGELLPYLKEALRKQLSPQSYENISYRLAPINCLKKIIDKLSAIYQQPVTRRIVEGTGGNNDADLLSWYEQTYRANEKMNAANEFFNLFRNTLLQPYVDRSGYARLRSIPSHQFKVWSDDPIDPMTPTGVALFMGKHDNADIYRLYTDDEILIVNRDGMVISSLMQEHELDGSNPIGRLPFVYVNRSQNLLTPKPEVDLIKMTVLASVLVSDLNYISMFQTFSVLYGINIKDKGLKFAPNALWTFEQIDPDAKPELGVLKNQADINAIIDLIKFELEFWLSTRGLKGSAVTGGDETAISGVAKMIDNVDTTDERKRQVEVFRNAETELWDLTMHHLHPYWASQPGFMTPALFSPRAEVEVTYSEQVPALTRGDIVDALSKERNAGFISKFSAMKRLNPHWSDEEITAELDLIDQENSITIIDQSEETDGQDQPT